MTLAPRPWVPRQCSVCKKWMRVGDAHCQCSGCHWCQACVAKREAAA